MLNIAILTSSWSGTSSSVDSVYAIHIVQAADLSYVGTHISPATQSRSSSSSMFFV